MAHCTKFTAAAAAHIVDHCERKSANHSNREIDPERSAQNYELVGHEDGRAYFRWRLSQIQNLSKQGAKTNVLCSWVVSAPKELKPEDERPFFQAVTGFLQERYGKENCVYAVVHKDETTPHLHFGFIPVVHDERRGFDRLCAKEVIDRKELRDCQRDLQKYADGVVGYHVGILTGALDNRPNKTLKELKREYEVELTSQIEAAREEVAALKAVADEQRERIAAKTPEEEVADVPLDELTAAQALVRKRDEAINRMVNDAYDKAEAEARNAHVDEQAAWLDWQTENKEPKVFGVDEWKKENKRRERLVEEKRKALAALTEEPGRSAWMRDKRKWAEEIYDYSKSPEWLAKEAEARALVEAKQDLDKAKASAGKWSRLRQDRREREDKQQKRERERKSERGRGGLSRGR